MPEQNKNKQFENLKALLGTGICAPTSLLSGRKENLGQGVNIFDGFASYVGKLKQTNQFSHANLTIGKLFQYFKEKEIYPEQKLSEIEGEIRFMIEKGELNHDPKTPSENDLYSLAVVLDEIGVFENTQTAGIKYQEAFYQAINLGKATELPAVSSLPGQTASQELVIPGQNSASNTADLPLIANHNQLKKNSEDSGEPFEYSSDIADSTPSIQSPTEKEGQNMPKEDPNGSSIQAEIPSQDLTSNQAAEVKPESDLEIKAQEDERVQLHENPDEREVMESAASPSAVKEEEGSRANDKLPRPENSPEQTKNNRESQIPADQIANISAIKADFIAKPAGGKESTFVLPGRTNVQNTFEVKRALQFGKISETRGQNPGTPAKGRQKFIKSLRIKSDGITRQKTANNKGRIQQPGQNPLEINQDNPSRTQIQLSATPPGRKSKSWIGKAAAAAAAATGGITLNGLSNAHAANFDLSKMILDLLN